MKQQQNCIAMRTFVCKVNAYEKALVFKNGELIRVLDQGNHWLMPSWEVRKYDITEMFWHETDLELLLRHPDLKERLEVVEIADDEMSIVYKDKRYCSLWTAGRYAYWKDGMNLSFDHIDLNEVRVPSRLSYKVLMKPEVLAMLTVARVERYEKALVYVDGELEGELAVGTHYYWKTDKPVTVAKVDTRHQLMEISGQELLTSDKAAIRMSVFADYRVVDIYKALSDNKDYQRQLYVAVQLGLREYVGQYSLDQLLRNKTAIAPFLLEYVSEKASELGVEINDCGVRDIIMPGDIKEIMNQVLVAEKKAQANTIMRREETASTRSLLNTAKLMEDNDMLFKLKEMEYMERIADKVGEITVNGGERVVDQLRDLIGSK